MKNLTNIQMMAIKLLIDQLELEIISLENELHGYSVEELHMIHGHRWEEKQDLLGMKITQVETLRHLIGF